MEVGLGRGGARLELSSDHDTMLEGRSMTLGFNDFVSRRFEVQSGLDQGCPLSPILFAFYTAALMEKTEKRGEESMSYKLRSLAPLQVGSRRSLVAFRAAARPYRPLHSLWSPHPPLRKGFSLLGAQTPARAPKFICFISFSSLVMLLFFSSFFPNKL